MPSFAGPHAVISIPETLWEFLKVTEQAAMIDAIQLAMCDGTRKYDYDFARVVIKTGKFACDRLQMNDLSQANGIIKQETKLFLTTIR